MTPDAVAGLARPAAPRRWRVGARYGSTSASAKRPSGAATPPRTGCIRARRAARARPPGPSTAWKPLARSAHRIRSSRGNQARARRQQLAKQDRALKKRALDLRTAEEDCRAWWLAGENPPVGRLCCGQAGHNAHPRRKAARGCRCWENSVRRCTTARALADRSAKMAAGSGSLRGPAFTRVARAGRQRGPKAPPPPAWPARSPTGLISRRQAPGAARVPTLAQQSEDARYASAPTPKARRPGRQPATRYGRPRQANPDEAARRG